MNIYLSSTFNGSGHMHMFKRNSNPFSDRFYQMIKYLYEQHCIDYTMCKYKDINYYFPNFNSLSYHPPFTQAMKAQAH